MYNKPKGVSLQLANKQLVTFAFTRYPFQRLASAYNAKFVNRTKFVHMGGFNASFGPMKFAECVVKDYHLVAVVPQYLACPHCQLEFDFVGKLEDMERNTAFLAQHLGLRVKVYYMFTFIAIQYLVFAL